MRVIVIMILSSYTLIFCNALSVSSNADWPEYKENPFKIKVAASQHISSGRGGIIVSDVNNDGLLDYIVSTKTGDFGEGRATIGAYDHYGEIIWVKDHIDIILNGKAEDNGLPGWNGPGISAADIDEDNNTEVIHLSTNNEIIIRDGLSGDIKKKIIVRLPEEGYVSKINLLLRRFLDSFKRYKRKAVKELLSNSISPKRWSHFQIVNLEGTGDDEIILQADPVPFRWLKAVSLKTGKILWENHDYIGLLHGGFRAADIDGDGFDEVIGAVLIDQNGKTINNWKYRWIGGHFDSLFIRDVLPNEPGLEWILLEESWKGDDRTTLIGKDKVFFYHSFNGWEPQNAAIGEFDTTKPGLEIWCRSRFDKDQNPWVMDSSGNTISFYKLNYKKPDNWSEKGIEFIYTIDWDSESAELIAAKERHVDGKVAILDPLTGEFIKWWEEHASRLYVADVAGDYREEVIVINSVENEIRIYWNSEKNNIKRETRYWENNYYQRQKLNYNYYSP